jgi:glycerol dehydrogenase-like iron-containing ADH family enzyme
VVSTTREPRVAIPTFGRGLLESLQRSLLERPVVLAQPEPWALVAHLFPESTRVHFVTTMEHDAVRQATGQVGTGSAVFGIGGGSAVDHAKYVAWTTGRPLVLVPSILSVDAAFTKAIGVREGSRVRYVGEVYPEHLLIDFGLLSAAPRILNLAGAGDVLSIFTALWDWRVAGRWHGEFFDADIAAQSQGLLDRLLAGAPDLRDVTDTGLRTLAELYVGEVRLCEIVGNSRPEEGSEHYVAYCLEHLTGRHFLHGALVGMGVLLAGAYQGQDVGPIARYLREIGLDCSFAGVGTTRDEVRACLLAMGDYVRQETQLLPGVFHFRDGITGSEADRVIAEVERLVA